MSTAGKTIQGEGRGDSGRPRPPSHRRHRFLGGLVALSALVLLGLAFPRLWGPPVVSWVVSRCLPLGDGAASSFTVDHISATRLEVSDIRLGGLPMAPSCRSLSVRYTLPGLLFSEIESIHLEGVSLHPGEDPAGGGGPVRQSAGAAIASSPADPPRPVDLLHGFSVCKIVVKDLSADCTALLPPSSREVLADHRLEVRIEGGVDGPGGQVFRGHLTGKLFGGTIGGALEYLPHYASPKALTTLSASLSLHPRLIDSMAPFPGPLLLHGEASFMEGKGLEIDFNADATCGETAWRLEAKGRCDSHGYQGEVVLPPAVVTQDDGLVQCALALAPPALLGPLASLEFQAGLSATATVSTVTGRLPEWKVLATLSETSFSTVLGEKPAGATGIVARVGCSGIGDRIVPFPASVSVAGARIGPFPFGKGRFLMIIDKKMLLMTSGTLGFCGGKIRAYSLYLAFDNLRSGFTLFLDQIAVDKLAKLFPDLEGSGRGRLYGQLPLRVTADHELRLRNAFLYARPGETGNIRFGNTAPIVEKLLDYGIEQDYCDTIGFALRNLDYDLLRFDLTRPRKEDGRLAIRLEGRAMDGKKPTPVSLNVNLNGPIEKLLNLGIKTATITR